MTVLSKTYIVISTYFSSKNLKFLAVVFFTWYELQYTYKYCPNLFLRANLISLVDSEQYILKQWRISYRCMASGSLVVAKSNKHSAVCSTRMLGIELSFNRISCTNKIKLQALHNQIKSKIKYSLIILNTHLFVNK